MNENIVITIETIVNSPISKVWESYTNPDDIVKWNNASDDWYTPTAENDLREGGKFNFQMEAKDKSDGFDFSGVYTKIEKFKKIEYKLGDERKIVITFEETDDNKTKVEISFDAEHVNSEEDQKAGWQAILNNFKRYVEQK